MNRKINQIQKKGLINILNDWRINMKKIMLMLILILTTVSCELFDMERWERIHREQKERGRTCYRDYSGYFYCEDKYGNPD